MNLDAKIDFYFKVLARLDGNISIADGKAISSLSHLYAIMTIFTGVVGTFIVKIKDFSMCNLSGMQTSILILVILNIFLFYGWYSACTKVIKPNTSNSKKPEDNYTSVIFFASIHSMELNSYLAKSKSLSQENELDDLLKQTHIVSKIVDDKYKDFKKVNKWITLSMAVFLFILLLVLSQFQGVK